MGTRKRAAAAAAGARSAAARLVHDCTLPHWTDISGFTTAELRAGQALLLTGQAVLEVLQGAVDVDGFLVTVGDAPLPLSTAGQVGLAITLTAQAHATQ
ncbi:CLP1_P domain-containing protein, partial [Haematococcus lacustris]